MLPPPPPSPLSFERKPPKRRSRGAMAAFIAVHLLALAAIVGVLVWGLRTSSADSVTASRTPASSPVAIDRQPLTQAGADAAAGALLVAWEDVDHLQFVAWDIHRMTGCSVLAVNYRGPDGRTDPRSIPDDIQADVVGRARRGPQRLTVWFGCEEER